MATVTQTAAGQFANVAKATQTAIERGGAKVSLKVKMKVEPKASQYKRKGEK